MVSLHHRWIRALITSCCFWGFYLNPAILRSDYSSPEYVREANRIAHAFIKEAEKEFGVHCQGMGGQMPHDIVEIDIGFVIYKKASIEEARDLEVKLIEKFLKMINESEDIK